MSPLAPADRAAAHGRCIGGTSGHASPVLDEVPWAYRSPASSERWDSTSRSGPRTERSGATSAICWRVFRRSGRTVPHLFVHRPGTARRTGDSSCTAGTSSVSITSSPSSALRHLFWDVNRNVVERTRDLLLFHASAVEHRGRAVVFPAPMGSGKTTLVSGLLQRGARYVTDEAVALDPSDLKIRPYPKPLSIESGSWDVLSDLRPRVDASLEPFLEAGWYVPADAIRDDAVASPCVPRLVICSPVRTRGSDRARRDPSVRGADHPRGELLQHHDLRGSAELGDPRSGRSGVPLLSAHDRRPW